MQNKISARYFPSQFIFLLLLVSSCASLFYYKNPEAGAVVNVNGIQCSTTCSVNGQQTRGNLFKIPTGSEVKVDIYVKKYVNNGYYHATRYFTLTADDYKSTANIDIEYLGDGKFNSSFKVSGMSITMR